MSGPYPERPRDPPTGALPSPPSVEFSAEAHKTVSGARTEDEVDLFPTLPTAEAVRNAQPFDPRMPVLPSRFGAYILEQRIDAGGMGVVYKARQLFNPAEPSMSRVVALKMILLERLSSPQVVKRFLAEAHSAAQLEYHPNIVQIYDVGEIDGQPYFSMQFIAGGSLQQIVDEQHVLPPPICARLVRKVADAVHFAHTESQIIHRDIKPSNILLGRDTDSEGDASQASDAAMSFTRWAPKLTDFGLARTADSSLTVQGEVMGTPSYMPPEQARGDLERIGPRSDVYSLGAVLYALLTGRPPFAGPDSQSTITRLLNDEPVPPRSTEKGKATPPDLERICLKCLAKNPARRYESARALAEDLDRFLAGTPVLAQPPQPLSVLLRKFRRRAPQLIGILLVLACVAFLIFFVIREKERKRRSEEAYTHAVTAVESAAAEVSKPAFKVSEEWARELEGHLDHLKRLPEDRGSAQGAAEACYALADRLWEHGFKVQATRAAEAAAVICDRLEEDGTFDDEDRFLRAQARRLLGRIAVEGLFFEDADVHYRKAIRDLQNCSNRDSNVIRKEAEVYHGLGEMYNAQSERKLAVGEYRKSIELCDQLTKQRDHRDPSAREAWNNLARGYGYLGDTYLDLGDLGEAKKAYDEAERIRRLLDNAFRDSRSRQQLARSFSNTGMLNLREGKRSEAIESLDRAVKVFEDLVADSEGSAIAEFKQDLAWTSLHLVETLVDSGSLAEAETLARRSLARYSELMKDDPGNLAIRRGRVRAQLDLAQCCLKSSPDAVDDLLDGARRDLKSLEARKETQDDPEALYLMAVGESIRAAHKPAEATRCLGDAHIRLGTAIKKGFANAEQLERDSRLSLFREKKKGELEEMIKDCRVRRKGNAGP